MYLDRFRLVLACADAVPSRLRRPRQNRIRCRRSSVLARQAGPDYRKPSRRASGFRRRAKSEEADRADEVDPALVEIFRDEESAR